MAGILSVASCNDNEPDGGKTPEESQYGINFSLCQESPSSRTHYATNDWLQLEWDLDDPITIACNQTQAPVNIFVPTEAGYEDPTNWQKKSSSLYKVTTVLDDYHQVLVDDEYVDIKTKSKANIKVSSGQAKDALYWTTGDHIFYAGFGEDIKIDPSTGTARCKYQTEQELTEVNGTWINMSQAYMVAYNKTKPTDKVDLRFKPIMTTVEVDVKGPPTGNVTIKAMEISVPATQDVLYTVTSQTSDLNAYFDYKITGQKTTGETIGEVVPSSDPHAEKFIFTLKEPKTITTGETVKITAILPPIEINNDDAITITIDAENHSNIAQFAKAVARSEKVVISTKEWVPQSFDNYVDLGLSVKWASCNLGANKPEENGDYYGWGCTMPYATSEYVYWPKYYQKIGGTGTSATDCGTDKDPLKDYVKDGDRGIAGTNWDAAHIRLGDKWRMPTKAELKELDECTWTPYVMNGVNGWLVINKTDANKYIFLPNAGTLHDVSRYEVGSVGYYWSGTHSYDNSQSHNRSKQKSIYMRREDSWFFNDIQDRYHGLPIRPVWDESMDAGIDRQDTDSENPYQAGDWE